MTIHRRRLAVCIVLAAVIALSLSVRLSHPRLHTDEITYMSSVLESKIQGTVFPVQGNGVLFLNKPPLSFWLMRLSYEVLGPSPFAARLPSALGTAGTGVVLYLFGAVAFGEAVGIVAALVFVFTPGLMAVHGIRSATPDALEILLVTSAIVCLELWRRRRQPWMLTCLVACVGVSSWVKSPFALVVFLAYLLATELPARRAGQGTPRLGATVALVAGVWLGIYLLWLGTLSTAMSPRAVAKRLLVQQYADRIEGQMGKLEGPGFYLKSVVGDFGPLLLLPLGAVAIGWLASRRGWKPSRHDMACLVAWSLVAPVLATASASKLPWYAYLSYPGIALLVAVSARLLAQAVSDRRSVQAALLAATILVVAWRVWRMPFDIVWPAEARYHGIVGRLWEIARDDPDIVLVPGPSFELPRQREDAGREARLYIRTLFWLQSGRPTGPDACRAVLVNRRRDAPSQGNVLELYRPMRKRGTALLLVDDCDGWLFEQLTGKEVF